MSRVNNPTIFRIVGIAMILLAIVNVLPSLGIFLPGVGPGSQQALRDESGLDGDDVGVDDTSGQESAIQSTGGITTTMGVLTLVHAPVLAAVGIALLLLKRWEMFAAIVLIIDALVRVGTILNNLIAPESNVWLIVVPVIFLVIDLVLTYVILQQWNVRRRQEGRASGERVGAA